MSKCHRSLQSAYFIDWFSKLSCFPPHLSLFHVFQVIWMRMNKVRAVIQLVRTFVLMCCAIFVLESPIVLLAAHQQKACPHQVCSSRFGWPLQVVAPPSILGRCI